MKNLFFAITVLTMMMQVLAAASQQPGRIKQLLQALPSATSTVRELLSSKPFPREGLGTFFDKSSLSGYLVMQPAVLKFLYRNGLVTEDDLREVAGNQAVYFKNIILKYRKPDVAIDRLLQWPYMQKLKDYYRDNLLAQGAGAGLSLAALGGLHYYHQWPLRAMQNLLQEFRDASDLKITLPMLQNIKNDAVFWQHVLSELDYKVDPKDVWTTLTDVLASGDRKSINTLLFLAVKRLQLMHGIAKYTPAGFFRKMQEMAGGFLAPYSGYRPLSNQSIDWLKRSMGIGSKK